MHACVSTNFLWFVQYKHQDTSGFWLVGDLVKFAVDLSSFCGRSCYHQHFCDRFLAVDQVTSGDLV
jgi:hypothetical protein